MIREGETGDITIESDVLVIGGGLAGCRAALKAKELVENVVLVDKAVVGRSSNTVACHAILGPTPEEDIGDWMREAVELAQYLSDQDWWETLLREQPKRLQELEEWGVRLVRDREGHLIVEQCRGMKEVCKGVCFDERFWIDHVRKRLISQGIKLVPRVMITDLLTSDGEHPTSGRVTGAVGFDVLTGKFHIFKARAVVISTGPMQAILQTHGNMTGDGQAMAFRAGAEMANLEFAWALAFTSLLKPPYTVGVSLFPFQNHGAYIINALGERFIQKYFPGRTEQECGVAELGQAFVREILDGRGPLFFDMRHWSRDKEQLFRVTLPEVMTAIDKAGINILKQPVEFKAYATWFSAQGHGGINTDLGGRTNVPGLFACGVSANARGGAEVFGSVSQANGNVFGYRAGENAGQEALQQGESIVHPTQLRALREDTLGPLGRTTDVLPEQLYYAISEKMLPYEYSVYKHERRIKSALAQMDQIEAELLPKVTAADPHNLVKANTVRNYLQISRLCQLASLERKESRLIHYREEYPYRDDINWLKWVILKRQDSGVVVRTEPVPLERYRFVPQERVKIPAKVNFGEAHRPHLDKTN